MTPPGVSTAPTLPTDETTRPTWPTWLRVAVVPVLMVVSAFSPLLPQVLLMLIPGTGPYLNDGANLAVSVPVVVLTYAMPTVVALVLVGQLMRRVDRRTLRDAGVLWTRSSAALSGVGLGVSAVVVLAAAAMFQGYARPLEPSSKPVWVTIVMAVAMAIVMQGFPEELLFRGYLMQTLRQRPMLGLGVSAVVFGAMHIVSSGGQQNMGERVVYVAHAAAFGFAAGSLVLLCRSLWPAVGVHAGLHLANLVAQLVGLSTEGPVLWAVAAAGYVAAGGIALALRARSGRWHAPAVLDR